MKYLKIVLILMSCLLMSCSTLFNQHKSFNIDQLSVEEKIGQLCLVSIYSSSHDTILRTIQEKHIGGVILYKENRYPETSLALKKSLNNIAAKSKSNIPIFTSIDHEGIGLGAYGTQFPRMMALGYLDDLDLTETVGFIMGQELHAAGIDVVYAPVLDVNLSASNTVIGARSFSDQPKAVAKHGRAFITGILNGQTIPVAKHFPGHGLTVQDSHIGLPKSNHSKQDIKTLALAPFKYSKQVPMVMTAHIFFSKLDAEYPATLSDSILTTLLRKKMKYKGVVITDHMDMKAVRKDLTLEEASLKAIQAGSDIIMLGENLNQIRSVIDFLVAAVNDGRLSMTRLNQAVQRVVDMKLNYALFNSNVNDSYKTILRKQSSLDVAESIIKKFYSCCSGQTG
jgi:beta-N-acetylhexosaminidase